MLTSNAILRQAEIEPDNESLQEAASLLGQSWDGANHQVLPHPTLGQIIACEAETKAQRFVFDDSAFQASSTLIRDAKSIKIACDCFKLPFSHTCIELPQPYGYLWLFKDTAKGATWSLWLKTTKLHPIHLGNVAFQDTDQRYTCDFSRHGKLYAKTLMRRHSCSLEDVAKIAMLHTPTLLIAFLNINGCAKNKVTFAPRQQRRAAKRAKKPCLISHNQVTLTFPKPDRPESGESHAEHSLRRHHAVIGHFRALTKGREEPKLTWVQPHFRGDPRMGVVVNTRTINCRTPRQSNTASG